MDATEILEQMDTFTQSELERIDQLATDTAGEITFEDMKLYARWETSNALAETRFKAEQENMKAESQARIEQAQALNDAAKANLEAQAALAQARLKAVQDGEV